MDPVDHGIKKVHGPFIAMFPPGFTNGSKAGARLISQILTQEMKVIFQLSVYVLTQRNSIRVST